MIDKKIYKSQGLISRNKIFKELIWILILDIGAKDLLSAKFFKKISIQMLLRNIWEICYTL